MIFLDAFVPDNGKALVDYVPPQMIRYYSQFKQSDSPVPPPPLEVLGFTDSRSKEIVAPRLVGQPWRTFFQPVQALNVWLNIPISHIWCSGDGSAQLLFSYFMEKMKAHPWIKTDIIRTGHCCMVTESALTTELLVKCGA
jgi:hypothetical protein